MFRVKKLILNEFGPYKGRQEIVFPETDGVVVFFGENGRGKTSLLNAIRFVLFDRILGRGSRTVDYKNILNWESAAEGKKEFSVELEFSFNDEDFHLIRVCLPFSGPSQKTETFLRRKGVSLAPDLAQKTISKIMPEQVSRFFLFDGELLQEYEDLLLETNQSVGIKDAIERILGVPILTNAISHLQDSLREAKRTEARSLESVSKTKHIGEALKQLQEIESSLEIDKKQVERDLAQARIEKLACESVMRENEKAGEVIGRKSVLVSEVRDMKGDLGQLEADLSQQSKFMWLMPLKQKIQEHLKQLLLDQDKIIQGFGNQVKATLAKRSAQEGHCALCSTSLIEGIRKDLDLFADGILQENNTSISGIQVNGGRIQKLQDIISKSDTNFVQHLIEQIRLKKNRIHEKEIEIIDLEKQLIGIDEKEISSSKIRFERVIKEISNLELQLSKIQTDLATKRVEIQEYQKSLGKVSEKSSSKDTLRRSFYDQLLQVFGSGLDMYRDRLRHHVEKESTALFRGFSSDKDYEKLKINQNYGLTIVHHDGTEIPVRSAGFEHIVALSLMGSLQKNAPLRGPIFMDSPMGRLDRAHKVNVTKGLPLMSTQVALLVYEDEISQDDVVEILGSKLLKRYHLKRISARHTIIEEK